MTKEKLLVQLVCLRCGYGSDPDETWMPRTPKPKECPKCKSRYWNKPKNVKV